MDRWKIWFNRYDIKHNFIGSGVHPRTYKHKSSAVRAAKRIYGESQLNSIYQWGVGITNPFAL